MENKDTRAAFEAVFDNADCENLIATVEHWANKPYRTPENVLEVVPCVQSGMHAFFARKEDEARKNWKPAEADAWKEARQTFDAGMRAFVDAIVRQPNPDTAEPERSDGWGRSTAEVSRPAIGGGWGRPVTTPKHDQVPVTTH